jgi:tRNA modification GTPase
METVDLRGFAFVITDTAGVRETSSTAESLAVARSRQAAASADILLRVFDGSCPLDDTDLGVLQLPRTEAAGICIINKSDLEPGLTTDDHRKLEVTGDALVSASAAVAGGCEELKRALVAAARTLKGDAATSLALGRERHRAALQRALAAIVGARVLMTHGEQAELASIELRVALAEIAGITEALDNEQVLDRIFASFCLGK